MYTHARMPPPPPQLFVCYKQCKLFNQQEPITSKITFNMRKSYLAWRTDVFLLRYFRTSGGYPNLEFCSDIYQTQILSVECVLEFLSSIKLAFCCFFCVNPDIRMFFLSLWQEEIAVSTSCLCKMCNRIQGWGGARYKAEVEKMEFVLIFGPCREICPPRARTGVLYFCETLKVLGAIQLQSMSPKCWSLQASLKITEDRRAIATLN